MSTGAKFAVSVVLVTYLTDHGYSLTTAAFAPGSIGVFQVCGRLLVIALRGRLSQHRATEMVFYGQGVAIVVLLASNGTGGLTVFVVLFGLGFGLEALLRGTLLAEYYGAADYPRINGVLGAFVVGARGGSVARRYRGNRFGWVRAGVRRGRSPVLLERRDVNSRGSCTPQRDQPSRAVTSVQAGVSWRWSAVLRHSP